MKKLITAALVIASLLVLTGPAALVTEDYAATGIVVETDDTTDTVTVEDFTGNRWCFLGVEDWMPGDICSMVMNDNGTPDITDDIILSARYTGYIC